MKRSTRDRRQADVAGPSHDSGPDRRRPHPTVTPDTGVRAFDVVGDVHGCLAELTELLDRLGYRPVRHGPGFVPPEGRMLVLVGDLVDRGPDIVGVLDTVMAMVAAGTALSVVGNHDDKLHRALLGRPVKIAHGLADSLEQLARAGSRARERVRDFLGALPGNLVLDDGRLVVAHAGLPERLHGDASEQARDLAMYGPTKAGRDEHGLPIRLDWTASYRGEARVVYGHTPVVRAVWRGNTLDVDTGCAYGGLLTACRYPEGDTVSVPARQTWAVKGGPFRQGGPGGPPATAEELAEARIAAGGEPVAPLAEARVAQAG